MGCKYRGTLLITLHTTSHEPPSRETVTAPLYEEPIKVPFWGNP